MDRGGVPPVSPFVVVEARPGTAGSRAPAALTTTLEAARADGWTVLRGWAAPMQRDRIVCTGWIRTPDDARRALLAAVAGARLAVAISVDRDTMDRFVDDLRRIGPVEHVTAQPTGPARLTAQQRTLLELLAEGLTIREAAAELDIAPRTATRRVAAARITLGVDSTAAAIVGAMSGRR